VLVVPGSLVAERRLLPRWVDVTVLTDGRPVRYRRRLDRPDRPWVRVGPADSVGGDAIPPPDGRRTLNSPSAEQLGADSRHLRGVETVVARGRTLALADEDGSVFEYRLTTAGRWERVACLRLNDATPFEVAGTESVKIAQVTGDRDATPTPWGERAATLSSSLASAGVRGADLGVRVDHGGRTFLLFGDTHWTRPWLSTRDSIAEVLPGGDLPGVRFHGSPLKLVGRAAGRVTMREYDVPLDGFSSGGRLYGLFSTNHFRGDRVMGRSVLARAVEADPVIDPAVRRHPVRFDVLGTFSDRHFINASVQLRPASAVPGFGSDGEVLLVWGSGPYRASEPRLAVLDASALRGLWITERKRNRPLFVQGSGFGVRYWTGSGWSDAEADARPLFTPAALGELSVRWVEAAGRYVMLYASAPEDPIGPAVVLRTAPQPWGPWSRRVRLLDWVATGMSIDPHTRFIKASRDDEAVGDRIFRAQASGTGAAYAPYLFDAVAEGDDLVIRYTLSTWNPYQVVLMRHRLPLR
jgi:hypothetical protein